MLPQQAPVKILYLDESGDHNLAVIDPTYPLFVLGGVIVDLTSVESVIEPSFAAFKRRLFGREDVILHTADISRNRKGFERMKDPAFRSLFYEELNALIARLEFKVVACAVRKQEHLQRYGVAALDPYLLSLDVLVERFCFELDRRHGSGLIVAESRDPVLDRHLELAWSNLQTGGTRFVSATDIRSRIAGLHIRSKSDNIAGLQLADLVVSPLGRHLLGKSAKEDFRIVESKLRRGPRGQTDGFGLVVLPKENGPAPATQ